MSMNFMSHTFTLTCALAAALCIVKARKSGSAIWGGLGGVATGLVSLIRPLDGLIVAVSLGLVTLGINGRRLKISAIAAFVVSTIIIGATILAYNKQITGDPTTFPLTAYYEQYYGHKSNALGFGPERGLGWAIDPFPGHSPLEALINANLNTFAINIELFGWSTGSLFFIILFIFSGRMKRSEYFLLAFIMVVVVAYSLHWYSGGPDFGARYWYLILIPLVMLTVKSVQFFDDYSFHNSIRSCNLYTSAMIVVMTLCVISFINFFPWRAIDKYHHYRGRRPDIAYLAKKYSFGRSLVLVQGDSADYLSAWIYNPLHPFADAPIYAWDQNLEIRARVLEAYPDRPVWIVKGTSITHGPFQVIDGPLSISQVRKRESNEDRF